MDQRIEFAMKALGTGNFRELCREYGISAKTGYKWRARFLRCGWSGMEEESRRPRGHAAQLGEAVICEMVRLKQAHTHWGPRKIRDLYLRQHGGEGPSESSFKRILERAGLTQARRLRPAEQGGGVAAGRRAEKPNDIWTVDFKGWWKDAKGLRVEPLTVRDEHSRMLLEMKILGDNHCQTVRRCFERLFSRHGLPGAMRSDNGPPFATCRALLGLSHLSAWWLALGIDLERNRPGCPQDNGAHERLHRDVRQELEAGRVGRDQAAFDLWRQEYNQQRPHEALGMKTPAEVYRPSERTYHGTPEDLDYGGAATRKVQAAGHIGYGCGHIFLSTALRGWSVGLKPQANGRIEVWFSRLLLGHIDPHTASFTALRMDGQRTSSADNKKM